MNAAPKDAPPYAKGQRVEVKNANGCWHWQGYATGRADCRGVEVTVYPPKGDPGPIRTAYYHPDGVRAYE